MEWGLYHLILCCFVPSTLSAFSDGKTQMKRFLEEDGTRQVVQVFARGRIYLAQSQTERPTPQDN